MRQRLGSVLLTVGAAAVAVGFSATSSFAATGSWNVSPGGAVTLKKSGVITIKDATSGNSVVCVNSAGKANFKAGTGLSGAHFASIKPLTFTSCTGPSAAAFTVTATLPWVLNAVSYRPAVATTNGTATGIEAAISGTSCTATLDGTSATGANGQAVIHYHNSPAKLKIEPDGSNLHVYNVTGCTGLFKSGDAVTLNAAYTVSPAQTVTESA